MAGYRPERVAEMIHKELARRLLLEIKDPRVVPISITNVTVNKDLSVARVRYLPLGGGEPSEELRAGLQAASRKMRGPIGRALRLRHAPSLQFEFDIHHDDAIRITRLLDELTRAREGEEGEE